MSKIPKVVVGVERWADVPTCARQYEVSDQGRVRSKPRYVYMARWYCGKILKPQRRDGGFIVRLYVAGKWQQARVHHLVLEAFVGPCPDGMECRHLDGDFCNNKLENLRWGTHLENMKDRSVHGTVAKGEKHGRAKLQKADVANIRAALSAGSTCAELARHYCVDHSTIRRIRDNVIWAE